MELPQEVSLWTARFRPEKGATLREIGKARSRATQALLARGMQQTALEPWEPAKDARGAPLPKDGWFVSKSHCTDLLTAALTRGPLGIDVETMRLSRVASWDRVIDAGEKAVMGAIDALAFTRLWTAKEAVLKADGIGIGGLSQCRVVAVLGPQELVLKYQERDCVVQQRILERHVISVYARDAQTVSWNLDASL